MGRMGTLKALNHVQPRFLILLGILSNKMTVIISSNRQIYFSSQKLLIIVIFIIRYYIYYVSHLLKYRFPLLQINAKKIHLIYFDFHISPYTRRYHLINRIKNHYSPFKKQTISISFAAIAFVHKVVIFMQTYSKHEVNR